MQGNQVIAQILKAEGVDWLSCFPAQGLIDVASMEGIRPIMCRQERAGVNMADGYSRITNGKKIGVFTMQTGPGAENAFSGVAQAFSDSVPILLLPGGQPASRMGVHPNFEAVPNYQGVTKWAGLFNQVERIPEMMSRAFTHLRHGRLGAGAAGNSRRCRRHRDSPTILSPTHRPRCISRAPAPRTCATWLRRFSKRRTRSSTPARASYTPRPRRSLSPLRN